MLRKTLTMVLLAALSASASAKWQADDVEVSFLTTKVAQDASTVTEFNKFDKAQASVDAQGKLTATINLASVNTGIEIRDSRLRDHIFARADGLSLQVSGEVDVAKIEKLAVGEQMVIEQPLHLMFATHATDVTAQLQVVRLADDMLSVSTLEPILLDVTALDAQEGVHQLTELAGLHTIALQVPTMLSAQFKHVD